MMKITTRTLRGELCDVRTLSRVTAVTILITQGKTGPLGDHPERTARATLEGIKLQLADQAFILRINETISGMVLLESTRKQVSALDHDKREYIVRFHDPIWLKADLFNFL